MSANRLRGFRRASLWLTSAGVLLGACVCLQAGERIEIGHERSKFEPPKDSKLGQELFKNWKPKADTDPMGTELMMSLPRYESYDFDPKQDKMRKLKQQEDENWMFVKPGELREEEEAKMGLRDDTMEPLTKEDDTRNLMFRGLIKKTNAGQDKKGTGRSGQAGNRNNNNAPPPPVKDDEDGDLSASLRNSLGLAAKSENASGARTDKQADFQKLFEAPGSSTRESEQSELTVYKPGTSLNMTREQLSSRAEFRSFLSGPAASSSPGGSSDSFNLRPESKSPGLGGILNRPVEPYRTPGGVDSFSPRASQTWDSSGRSDINSGGISGFGTLSPRPLTPETPKPFAQPSFDTRARGMNSLGGHR